MFEALLRRHRCEVFNRLITVRKLLNSDSAVVRSRPKLKSLVMANTTRIKGKFKGKFIENLFLDKFDPKILEYPQLDTLIEYQILNKHRTLVQELLSAFLDKDSKVYKKESEKLVSSLKELEFTGFKVPREDGGFGYLNSEYTFLQEEFGAKPSLSKTISENEDFGIHLISLSGNETKKNEYLPKLTSGQSIACIAHLESQPLVSRDPMSLNTTAVKTPDGYVVSGIKNWVYNASYADVIIFSANVISEDFKKGKPMLFIADKSTPGIEVHKPFNLMGMNGLDVCEVNFNEVLVPLSNVLGDAEDGSKLIKQVLSNGKLSNGAQCIAIMKKLVNMAITHCIHNKFFNKNKYEKNYYRIKIANIASRVYTVESMTYLLSGRLDSHDEADIFLESLIGKIFASENLQYVLQQTLIILGSDGFLEKNEINDIIKDSQFFLACDNTNDQLKLMLSSAGCEYMLNNKVDDGIFRRMVNSISKNIFKINWLFDKDSQAIKTRRILRGHLHMMFAAESHLLETSVFILHVTAERLIKKYGYKVFDRHLELNFLADIVIKVYAMTATLGRASRAFCLGMKNDQADKNITYGEVHRMYYEIQNLRNVIQYSKFSDAPKIGSEILNCKSFADQYPITENLLIRNKCN